MSQSERATLVHWFLNNHELKEAIDYAWIRLNTTGSIYSHYAPMLEHYKALLKEQERRAKEPPAPSEVSQ